MQQDVMPLSSRIGQFGWFCSPDLRAVDKVVEGDIYLAVEGGDA